ncbi:carboxymuconolactone decarboxylase family protein [Streptomyces sp. Li-HN-5-11]|uniref:carboxymuconolactone decarboxylase family protein n=1 Tax=Streptomyces sp. Li-HN-5-11 TaxID=3075432 RepID=UPI0028ACCB41|nr:carboxymuconolactone decarboxylase family protein [Streptomyces sp. Li-HN-5-11]WNM31886.1 carboxymuconolactone decarboxylase family protein [Streptomyces sp. Li-HN-5-11]
MYDGEWRRAAGAARAEVLGDDGTRLPPGDPVPAEFQDYLVSVAWGAWARGGPLSHRDRSLLVLAMTAALGRMDEFRLHLGAAPRAGVSDAEVDELLFQIAAYCGAPAGNSARAAVREVRGAREET